MSSSFILPSFSVGTVSPAILHPPNVTPYHKLSITSPPIKSPWLHRVVTVSPMGDISPDLSPPTDSILSTNTTQKNEPGSEMVTEWQGVTWDLQESVSVQSVDKCDGKCDPGFARTPYKHHTPCWEFDNWISEILNTTNIFCAAEIRSGWCWGGALTKWTQKDYLNREGEQTVTVKQISPSFDRNFPFISRHLTLVSCWERESFCVSCCVLIGWHNRFCLEIG